MYGRYGIPLSWLGVLPADRRNNEAATPIIVPGPQTSKLGFSKKLALPSGQ